MACGGSIARTGGPVREDGGVDGDVALQHARERAALLRGRRAEVLAVEKYQLRGAQGEGGLGGQRTQVRVTSVVPSRYWPEKSDRQAVITKSRNRRKGMPPESHR